MMNRLIIIAVLLFRIIAVDAQELTRLQADSLIIALKKKIPDLNRINALLKLAEFQVLKPGELKSDFDSAENYLNKAAVLNATVNSREALGYQNLILSKLNKEKKLLTTGKNFAETAVKILKNERNSYLLGDAYFDLSQYYDYSDPTQIVEKIRLVELAIQQFQQSGNVERFAYTLQFAGDLYQVNNENSKALEKLDLSLKAYESIHSNSQVQGIYLLYGSIYYNEGNFKQALNYSLRALKVAEETGDSSVALCQIKNRIGTIYFQLSEKEKAISYFKEALVIAEKYNDNKSVLLLMYNIARNMLLLNRLTEALTFMESIPKKFLVPKEEQSYIYEPLSYLHVYFKLKNYDQANVYSKKVVEVLAVHRNQDRITNNAYMILAGFYMESKQYALANSYLNKVDSLSKKMGDAFRIAEGYLLKFRLDSTMGDYSSAITNLLNYKKINDSLFNETKSKQIKQLEVEYETAKKEQELKLKDNAIRLNEQDILLLTKQSELQQKDFYQTRLRFEFDSSSKEQSLKLLNLEAARKDNDLRFKQQDISLLKKESLIQQIKLKETKTTRNFIIVGAIMLLLLLGLGYNRYRLKIQVNKELKAKQREINRNNESLKHLLTEKEWLLKEVHHRVKNNLHTVICLLESQAAYLENDALKANENTQHRIYAMSLIHQKLYKSEDIKTIDMSTYLPEFIDYLKDSFGIQQQIRFNLMIESLKLGVSQAIPIALILNEAVTNSIKYAFPEKKEGTITISIHQLKDEITLIISDNGIGMEPEVLEYNLSSLGLKLMKGLTEDIDGKIYFENSAGLKITVKFNVDPLNQNEYFLSKVVEKEVYS